MKLLKKNIKYISLDKGFQTSFDSKHWSRFNKDYKNDLKRNQSATSMKGKSEPTFTTINTTATLNEKEKATVHASKADQNNLKVPLIKHQKSKSEVKFNKKDIKSENSRYNFTRNKKGQQADKGEQLDLLENWFECWQTKKVDVVLNYGYYPCPVINWNDRSKI